MNEDKYWEGQRIKQDPMEGKVCLNCNRCGAEIYEGQEYYIFESDSLCEECFNEMQHDEKRECERIAGDDDEY